MGMCTAVEPGDRSQDVSCRCTAGKDSPKYAHSGGGQLQGSRLASCIYGWLPVQIPGSSEVKGEVAR